VVSYGHDNFNDLQSCASIRFAFLNKLKEKSSDSGNICGSYAAFDWAYRQKLLANLYNDEVACASKGFF